ncbi:tetratricopeptide repeat protein [Mesorhizobium kowhaii]|uniref:tetratricopeptide repeat protein n=1 Tax=Mesorhizobium kowhaii TaxID=1300272 RepID=UPI00142E6739|nr:tetratricopeptide repeat protein [Mesorhizobium kowhaii]
MFAAVAGRLFHCLLLAFMFELADFSVASNKVFASDTPGFVGSGACAACHQDQARSWSDSHHGWALRPATVENVLGDFNDANFTLKGLTSRFSIRDGRYFVETDGADGKPATFEVKYTVGVSPLQQYLVELDGGRLQPLDLAWDVAQKRWFHLYPDTEVSAGNGLHWTGPYKNWQARCAVCHQTDFRKNFDPASHGYKSQWSDLTVGCEACHGPGSAHVAWAEKRTTAAPDEQLDPHGWMRRTGISKQAVEQDMCGPCHSRREALGADSTLPTGAFGDGYRLSYLANGSYFADGQQEGEVYVLGSFLQSKMHEKGVTCTNCHDPHSGQLVAEGNAVCTQCHNEVGRPEFPTLKRAVYDASSHHHHVPGTPGSQCVSCHMPERNYMVVDARRDHFFRIPDPLLSEKVGSPSACLSCHTAKSAQWAADAIGTWYPEHKPGKTGYGEAFAAARRDGLNQATISGLVEVASDASKTAIVRASAVAEIGDQADAEIASRLLPLLSDNSDLVRRAAVQLWRNAPEGERVAVLLPLLDDKIAAVRLAAALELSIVQMEGLPAEQRSKLRTSLENLRASMAASADFPEGQMAIGGLAMATRNWDAAKDAFAEAAFFDPQLVDAWLSRARISSALGDVADATSVLSTGYQKNPGNAVIALNLGQLFIQQGRLEEAETTLKTAVGATPDNQELRITLAIVLLHRGNLADAKLEIDALLAVAPQKSDVLMLLGLWEVASGNVAGARKTVRKIQGLYPGIQFPGPLDALSRMP